MSSNEFQLAEILLVEDDPGDVRLVREAMKDNKIINKLHVVDDGVKALAFLHKEGEYAKKPRPAIILLDLNLPKKDGRAILAEIKQDDNLRLIPVVILTASKSDEDIIRSYNTHANCYITKPIDMDQFARIVKTLKEFWFTIVKLPSR